MDHVTEPEAPDPMEAVARPLHADSSEPRTRARNLPADGDLTDRWVARAREGDVEAFEALYRAHGGRVHALCLRMCGDAREAEELTQDVWVRVWDRLSSFRGESAFTTLLHRLTVNEILGRRRTDGRRANRFDTVANPAVVADGAGLQSTKTAPPGTRLDLERALATLPEGARTVFVLYDVEGYLHREIADQLGVAEGTVKAQLHRARRMLREALER
jgi:RNA polymerase sigma-70 factor, ECF subfamily